MFKRRPKDKIIKVGDGRLYVMRQGRLYWITGPQAVPVFPPPTPVKPKEEKDKQ